MHKLTLLVPALLGAFLFTGCVEEGYHHREVSYHGGTRHHDRHYDSGGRYYTTGGRYNSYARGSSYGTRSRSYDGDYHRSSRSYREPVRVQETRVYSSPSVR